MTCTKCFSCGREITLDVTDQSVHMDYYQNTANPLFSYVAVQHNDCPEQWARTFDPRIIELAQFIGLKPVLNHHAYPTIVALREEWERWNNAPCLESALKQLATGADFSMAELDAYQH